MDKITPFLWFEKDADVAAKFYVSIFKPAKIVSRSAMATTVELRGQRLILFNGGSHLTLTPAASLFVDCKSQQEVDFFWGKLLDGGQPSRCGWLTDRYGLSWQIVPTVLGELLGSKDRAKAQRVMNVMMTMAKLDVQALKDAAVDPNKPEKPAKKTSKPRAPKKSKTKK
jgi:predicted 3-demethylubiquinone-9 3-methyltransferase (glyoxalase superfamily)